VVAKDGKPYTGGGNIEFRLASGSQHGSFGKIADDGSFTLKTIAGTQTADGAQEGEHIVTIVPLGGTGQEGVRHMQLKTRYTIKAGEVNHIVVKLEK
jgi:hypothetical protein